jgi:OOP family OmpA-OmpF porin
MFKNVGKRNFLVLMAPVSLAVGLSLGSFSANAGSYVTSETGETVYGGFQECWHAVSGTTKNVPYCGDVVSSSLQPVQITSVADSDSDGVVDSVDECPESLYGAIVNSFGCFEDSDNDGVADSQDRCPDSAVGADVNAQGCASVVANGPLREVFDHFDFNKVNTIILKEADKIRLDTVADRIIAFADAPQVHVLGYTDSIGPEAYNLKLSERRAQTIADYLANLGVRNITVKGMGETSFVGDNDTPEGRALNRRVEIVTQ